MTHISQHLQQSLQQHKFDLETLCGLLDARLYGQTKGFNSLSIDTRTIKKGDLFIAIKGEKLDGHEYIKQAIDKGAIACVVEKYKKGLGNITQLVVTDCKVTLGKIAHLWRLKFNVPVVAITGSCGKTTVKEMLKSILENEFDGETKVLSTIGNLNNEYGVPLTLMRMNQQHKVAIIEMGANHLNEIAYLTNIVQPDIAVVTNAGNAHIEGFGSKQAIVKGKGELYQGIKNNAYAIINNDCEHADYWNEIRSNNKDRMISFAIESDADVQAKIYHEDGSSNTVEIAVTSRNESYRIKLNVPGKHNILNALAAISVSNQLNVKNKNIKKGLEQFNNIGGRLEERINANWTVINDAYNANPESVKAAIDVLAQKSNEYKILVLGDMGELGEQGRNLHEEVGVYAAQQKIDELITIGELTKYSHKAFALTQLNNKSLNHHFNNIAGAFEYIKTKKNKEIKILIKASRKMALENLYQQLVEY